MLYRKRNLAQVATFFVVILAISGLAFMPASTVKATPPVVRIALYVDRGANFFAYVAERKMFEWMGASVTYVWAEDVIGGALANFDILVMPGGFATGYKADLAGVGVQNIRDFISGGGGYIGFCAGAWFAADYALWYGVEYDYPLDILPGYGEGPVEELVAYPPSEPGIGGSWHNYDMTKINLVKPHPITNGLPEDYDWILYWGGPEFHVYEGADVAVIGTYDVNDEAAMVAFKYGDGKVFLTGVHPEFEEDSTRDGYTWENHFDDQGSDWPLMENVLWWVTH